MSNNSGGISQSNSGSVLGGMQAAVGNCNKQVMSTEMSPVLNVPAQFEVVEFLEKIECILRDAELPEVAKSKAVKYIEAAKIEAEESEPDKQLIFKNLERVTKNLGELDKTLDVSKRISEKIIPFIRLISSWLGMTIGFF